MQICCGVDIIEIERIRKSIENSKTGKAFLNRIYTIKEIDYCESKKKQKYQHYAARFAAKEAVFKAISEKLESKYSIDWKNIEIVNNTQGKPCFNLIGIELQNIKSMDLSISHCKQYAIANVTILFN